MATLPGQSVPQQLAAMSDSTKTGAASRKRMEHMNAQSDGELEAELETRKQGKFANPTSAAGVTHRDIDWLWRGFLPLGSLSLIYGHEGDGKSVVTAMIAALATLGKLPGKLEGEPTSVEFFAYEDDYAAVITPRLEAAGADLERCYFHGDSVDAEPLTLPDDVEALTCALQARDSRLVIIDPLTDALRDGLKENSNADVRRALVPLLKAAETAGACVLGVTHPNKGATEAANKVMGSKAWRSVPRSVMIYGPNPDDLSGDTRILAVSKANYSRKQSVKVRVHEVAVDGLDQLQAKAQLDGVSSFTDQDVIAAKVGATVERGEPSKQKAAEMLLYKLLEDGGGEIAAAVAKAAADAAGISEPTLQRAKRQLGLSGHTWALPESLTL